MGKGKPGGRQYEKNKSMNKRRGAPRPQYEKPDPANWREEQKKQQESEESSEEESSYEESSSENSNDAKNNKSQQTSSTTTEAEKVGLEVFNPNRAKKKTVLKASDIDKMSTAAPALSRREREELEAKKKRDAYLKATREGKTPEGKADLERLKKIRAEREAAKAKREAEAAAKEEKRKEAMDNSGRKAGRRR